MTAIVSKKFSFNSAIHFENNFIINTYDIDLLMEVYTEDMEEQTISLERIKFLFEECFENVLFISLQEDKSIIENYLKAGLKISTLPEDPYDQVIACVLMKKIDSICEDKLKVSNISIISKICEGVEFHISEDEESDIFYMKDSWWFSCKPIISDWVNKTNKKEKIVHLSKSVLDWHDVGLNWISKSKKSKNHDVVILSLDKE